MNIIFRNYCIKTLLITAFFQSNIILTIANDYYQETSQVQTLSDMMDILNIIKPTQSTGTSITLSKNGLANLVVLSLKNQANPAASYFVNSWNSITTALTNLTSGNSINFTIDETNNTISSTASTTVTDKLIVAGSPYLIIVTDSNNKTFATITTTNTFSLTVDATTATPLSSAITLPSNTINQFAIFSTNSVGPDPLDPSQTEPWLSIPTYITSTNTNIIQNSLNKSNPSCTVTLNESVTYPHITGANISFTGGSQTITYNGQASTEYIALIQDSNSAYHLALIKVSNPLTISASPANLPAASVIQNLPTGPTITLSKNGLSNLVILSLNNQANPAASYFVNSWNSITTALTNLTSGNSINFTIDETNNTISSTASTTLTDKLLVAGSPYLIIATDSNNETFAIITTTNTFSLTVDATTATPLTSAVTLPSNTISQFAIFSTNNSGPDPLATSQTVPWLSIPTYINSTNTSIIQNSLTKSNPSCSLTLNEVTTNNQITSASINFTGGSQAIAYNTQSGKAYIALIQDSNSAYHLALVTASIALTISASPANLPAAPAVNPAKTKVSTITLSSNTLNNLVVLSLNNQANPAASYFVNSWNAITTALTNLAAGNSINFTIDETNNTISSTASTTLTDKLLVAGSPYLIIATDNNNKTFAIITTTNTFSLTVDATTATPLSSTISLPSNTINQFAIISTINSGPDPLATSQTVPWLSIPTYINSTNTTIIQNSLNKSNPSCPVTLKEVTANNQITSAKISFTGGSQAIAYNSQADKAYIALIQDGNSAYHLGLITASIALTISAPPANLPAAPAVNPATPTGPTITLSSSTLNNLVVLSLNNQANPAASYFVNSWNAITTALTNLTSGQSINFTINETTNTISSSASTTVSDKLLVAGSPYLIFATDSNNNSFATITTTKSFAINVNASTDTPLTTTITIPSNAINQFAIFSTNSSGPNPLTTSQTVNWLSIPTYLSNTSSVVTGIVTALESMSAPYCNISVTETTSPIAATISLTANNSTATATIQPNNTTNTGYLALMQDNTNQYHTALFSATSQLLIQLPSNNNPDIINNENTGQSSTNDDDESDNLDGGWF